MIVLLHFNPMKLTVRDALLNSLMMNGALGIVPISLLLDAHLRSAVLCRHRPGVLRAENSPDGVGLLAWLAVSFLARWSHFDDRHVRIAVVLDTEFCQFFVLGMMIYLITQRRNTWLTTFTALLAFSAEPVWSGV